MKNNLISIAIPAYKATYLREAISSALNQTYTNFELIIVNDKSPENLNKIVKSFNDSRIRYYENNENLGKKSIVHNWNKCLSLAKGEFFVLLCDDDIMMPNFLKTMIQYTYKYPKCNVFKTRCYIIKDSKIIEETSLWDEFQTFDTFFDKKMRRMRKHTISEFLYRTSYIQTLQYIPFPIGYYSDDASIIRFIENGGICCSKEILMKFRRSDIHIPGNKSLNKQKVDAALCYYEWLKKNYPSKFQLYYTHIYDKISDDLYSYFIYSNTYSAIHILFLIPKKLWNIKKKIACFHNLIKQIFIK